MTAASPAYSEATTSSANSPTASSSTSTSAPPAKRRRGDPNDPVRKARLAARQVRNRQSAQNSRDRKKAEHDALEAEVVVLRQRTAQYESKITELERGYNALVDLVQSLMKGQTQTASSSTTASPATIAPAATTTSSSSST